MKIGLVVEDVPEIRKSIQNILRERLKPLGFERIDCAEDGMEALGKLNSENYAFVLTDIQMPKMSGVTLLLAIQGDEKLKFVPVIVMSGSMDGDRKRLLLEKGAVSCLSKPLDYDLCVSEIKRALAIALFS